MSNGVPASWGAFFLFAVGLDDVKLPIFTQGALDKVIELHLWDFPVTLPVLIVPMRVTVMLVPKPAAGFVKALCRWAQAQAHLFALAGPS